MSTRREILYKLARWFEHPLYQRSYRVLAGIERESQPPLRLLDVGGRRSNYTIGLSSRIWISDLPRESAIQHQLNLGATDEMRRAVLSRTNVDHYVLDDMVETSLPHHHFDLVVAIEVLEHVENDDAFVRNVARVLKPGGVFVMSTPNGDYLTRPYPDHKRHYRREQLRDVLSAHFPDVTIDYVVNAGALIRWGVHRPSWRAPLRTGISAMAFWASARLEQLGFGGRGPDRKRHLFAVARLNAKS